MKPLRCLRIGLEWSTLLGLAFLNVVIGVLWIRSYIVADAVTLQIRNGDTRSITSTIGVVQVTWWNFREWAVSNYGKEPWQVAAFFSKLPPAGLDYTRRHPFQLPEAKSNFVSKIGSWHKLGINSEKWDFISYDYWEVTVRFYWLFAVTLPSLLLVLYRLIRVAKKQFRLRNCLCIHCGYDLRASTGVCPECGSYCQM